MKRLFWVALAAAPAVACGASASAPGAEPSGRGSIHREVEPSRRDAAAASAPASAEALASGEAHDSGPPTRCRPTAGDGGAVVRCNPDRIVPGGPLLFHPDRFTPPLAQRATLDAVADLMHRRQDILLLRIQVSSHRAALSAAQQRRAMQQAQRRADALFRYLWRRRRVSAERMEALGLSAPNPGDPEDDYSTLLRILQWAPTSPGEASGAGVEAPRGQAASP